MRTKYEIGEIVFIPAEVVAAHIQRRKHIQS